MPPSRKKDRSKEPGKSAEASAADSLLRSRENQRRSRRNRKILIEELKEENARFKVEGVQVTQEIQHAARKVASENVQLNNELSQLRSELAKSKDQIAYKDRVNSYLRSYGRQLGYSDADIDRNISLNVPPSNVQAMSPTSAQFSQNLTNLQNLLVGRARSASSLDGESSSVSSPTRAQGSSIAAQAPVQTQQGPSSIIARPGPISRAETLSVPAVESSLAASARSSFSEGGGASADEYSAAASARQSSLYPAPQLPSQTMYTMPPPPQYPISPAWQPQYQPITTTQPLPLRVSPQMVNTNQIQQSPLQSPTSPHSIAHPPGFHHAQSTMAVATQQYSLPQAPTATYVTQVPTTQTEHGSVVYQTPNYNNPSGMPGPNQRWQ